ncbi:hypothetical protein [Paraburkholderia heleia]|uniref:hypothetical protein n=1 Tax=Paraburkholderia heleia TaxID=634127 RepID=UPI0012ED5871|nr:hypothetical protein [Paraburkholderia heleia]
MRQVVSRQVGVSLHQVVVRTLLFGFGEVAVGAFIDDQAAVTPGEPDDVRGLPQ